jgi:hypothetical protein
MSGSFAKAVNEVNVKRGFDLHSIRCSKFASTFVSTLHQWLEQGLDMETKVLQNP